MQRAKHADRKQETRTKILIGEAAMRAGAFAMPVEVIEAVLTHSVETGGSKELQAFVTQRTNSPIKKNQPMAEAKRPAEAMWGSRFRTVLRVSHNDL